MRKLTKDQRYYRKKKKEGEKDIVKLPRKYDGDRFKRWKVSRRAICIRVSLEASEKLTALSESESVKRWEMLSRILTYKIPKKEGYWYTQHPKDGEKAAVKSCEKFILEPTGKIRYKSGKGNLQIQCDISSTASNKLHALHLQTRYSKARIVQRLILDYELPSEAIKQARQKYLDSIKSEEESWNSERERQGETVHARRSKFIDIGMDIVHVKGIPIEYWSDEEIDEYHELIDKKMSDIGNPSRIQEEK